MAVDADSRHPLVALYLWVDGGVRRERPGEAGAAHLVEHLLFKGTERRGPGEAALEIEGLGGDLNAFTALEHTVLHATVPARAWRPALEVLVDLARRPRFDAPEVERERAVVLEELAGDEDDPEALLEVAVRARLFPGHPYGRRLLGSSRTVATLSRDALVAHWGRTFTADRLLLAAAGDVDPGDLLEAAAAELAGWPPGGGAGSPPPLPRARPGALHLRREFSSNLVEVAWPAPALSDPRVAALDVLSTALGEGGASLLDTRLQREEELAFDIWSELSARPLAGQLSLGFVPREGRTIAATRAALDEVSRAVRQGVPGAWVDRARRRILSDLLFGRESVDGRAHDLGWYGLRTGDPAGAECYAEAVSRVGPAAVHDVAGLLSPEGAVVGLLDGTLRPGATKRLARARRPVRRPPPGTLARFELECGARILVLPDQGPVAAARAVCLGGSLAEGRRTAGLARAWAAMVTAGAGDLDAPGLTEATDAVAANLEGTASRDRQGLRASFPAARAEEVLDLLGAAVVEPRFEAGEWPRVREELEDDLRTAADHPDELARDAAWRALFPGHPWSRSPLGTRGSLARLGPRGLSRHHRALVTGPNLVVAVAGGVSPGRAREALEPWLADLPSTPPELPPTPVPGVPRRGRVHLVGGHRQAFVVLAQRGAAWHEPHRAALDAAASMLAGQGGRLFLRLREERGLAYDVWAEHRAGHDGGVFLVGAATDPSRVEEVLEALRGQWSLLASQLAAPGEMDRSARVLAGLERMAWQSVVHRCSAAALGELVGKPWLPEERERLQAAVTAVAVRDAIAEAPGGGPVEIVVQPPR